MRIKQVMKKLHTEDDIQEMLEQSLRPSWRVGIVYSTFYKEEIKTMVDGAVEKLVQIGMKKENIRFRDHEGDELARDTDPDEDARQHYERAHLAAILGGVDKLP